MKILIVEDDADSGEALQQLLADLGHDVELVIDPRHAAAVSARFQPNVAILDIGLPVMSGFELIAHLRTLPELGCCSYISMSAYVGVDVARRSSLAGFEHHLTKPLFVSDLLARLSKLRHSATAEPS